MRNGRNEMSLVGKGLIGFGGVIALWLIGLSVIAILAFIGGKIHGLLGWY